MCPPLGLATARDTTYRSSGTPPESAFSVPFQGDGHPDGNANKEQQGWKLDEIDTGSEKPSHPGPQCLVLPDVIRDGRRSAVVEIHESRADPVPEQEPIPEHPQDLYMGIEIRPEGRGGDKTTAAIASSAAARSAEGYSDGRGRRIIRRYGEARIHRPCRCGQEQRLKSTRPRSGEAGIGAGIGAHGKKIRIVPGKGKAADGHARNTAVGDGKGMGRRGQSSIC